MKQTIISILIAFALIGGALYLTNSEPGAKDASRENVSIVDGKQVIEVSAQGGYSPRLTLAKAEVPTVLRMKTEGSFGCANAFTIPKLGYRANLPSSGTTDIELPPQKPGTVLKGLCAMGMYNFSIQFN